MSEWITAIGTIVLALGVVGSLVIALVKVSITITGNTAAIKTLTEYMAKKDLKDAEQDVRLEEHDKKFIRIETIHKMKGCDKGVLHDQHQD